MPYVNIVDPVDHEYMAAVFEAAAHVMWKDGQLTPGAPTLEGAPRMMAQAELNSLARLHRERARDLRELAERARRKAAEKAERSRPA